MKYDTLKKLQKMQEKFKNYKDQKLNDLIKISIQEEFRKLQTLRKQKI